MRIAVGMSAFTGVCRSLFSGLSAVPFSLRVCRCLSECVFQSECRSWVVVELLMYRVERRGGGGLGTV